MNSLRMVVIAALCLGFAAACAKSKAPEAGTNTNWLKLCTASADCAGDGDCLCGVCTLQCQENAGCAEVGRRTSCMPLSESTCGAGATGSACLPPDAPEDSGTPAPTPDVGLTLTRVGVNVQITDRYRICGIDDDCVLVATGCDGCCQQDAIRAHDRDAYQTNFEQVCSDYRGGFCNCQPLDLVPRCDNGFCTTVPRDPLRDCYSPTQNVQRANDSGAAGCACEQDGLVICVGGVKLACAQGASSLTWVAIGACIAPTTDCSVNAQRPDAATCLAEFASCSERQEGGFCGTGCHGPLDCIGAECQYTPPDLTQCDNGIGTGIWEGMCGDVRYRTVGGGIGGGPVWYWNNATGELLAMTAGNDIPSFCGNAEVFVVRGDLKVVGACPVVMDATTRLCPQ